MKILLSVIVVFIIGVVAWFFVNSLINQKDPTQTPPKHNIHAAAVTDEKSFIHGMIPHHEEAMTSSIEVLKVAQTPEVQELARKIIIAQKREVAEMKSLYQEWYKEAYKDDGKYKPMMPSLEGKTSEEAEQAYLHGMIAHHQAAIVMSEAVLKKTQRAQLQMIANNIIKTQNEEIKQMKELVNENQDTHATH